MKALLKRCHLNLVIAEYKPEYLWQSLTKLTCITIKGRSVSYHVLLQARSLPYCCLHGRLRRRSPQALLDQVSPILITVAKLTAVCHLRLFFPPISGTVGLTSGCTPVTIIGASKQAWYQVYIIFIAMSYLISPSS